MACRYLEITTFICLSLKEIFSRCLLKCLESIYSSILFINLNLLYKYSSRLCSAIHLNQLKYSSRTIQMFDSNISLVEMFSYKYKRPVDFDHVTSTSRSLGYLTLAYIYLPYKFDDPAG